MLIEQFLVEFEPVEIALGGRLLLIQDEKSEAFYIPCHLQSDVFSNKMDFEAALDGSDEEDVYKLNRNITDNESAFITMEKDAKQGRSFEDIVVEYDRTYNLKIPLKIYGGQHRIKAIQSASSHKPSIIHGFRIYFGLNRQQKVEIATINNTSITVSNDLLDRMKEQLLGFELRDFCQEVGLLSSGQDFSDRRDPIIPTVRIARTLLLNFYKGKKDRIDDFHIPVVCKSGGLDDDYQHLRPNIDWTDSALIEMGRNFSKLNKIQREKVYNRLVVMVGKLIFDS